MICRDAAEAISRSLDSPLSRVTRLSLRVHTLFCGPCRRFHKQLLQLHAECASAKAGETSASAPSLSQEARERIAAAIEKPNTD